MVQIRYQEPVNETNMSLLAVIAIIIFGGIIAVNFFPISNSAAEKATTNLAFIPALLLMVVLFGVGYLNDSATKKNLNQIISEYDNFSKFQLDNEKFGGFYLNNTKLTTYNYKPLKEMPKNIASYFSEEKNKNNEN